MIHRAILERITGVTLVIKRYSNAHNQHVSPQKFPFSWGPGPLLGPTRLDTPNGILICSAVFAQLTVVPNTQTQTDSRPTYVAMARIYEQCAGDAT